jgi:DNA mismatch repair protein MutS2
MSTISHFAVKTLEFDKVKELVAAKAGTSLGKKYLQNLQVSSDFSVVKKLQEETAEVMSILENGQRMPLGGMFDITAAIKQARLGSVLDAVTLFQVCTTAESFGHMKEFLHTTCEELPVLAEYGNELQAFPQLVHQLNNAISEKGEVKDSASQKLAGLRVGIISAQKRVKERLESILHDPNKQKYFQDNLVTMRDNRYVIPIKQEYKLNFPGVVHDQSSTGATLFVEPLDVVNLNNDIKRYAAEEKVEVERILKQLSQTIGQEADALLTALSLMTVLDAITAKAYFAIDTHAVRPQLLVEGGLVINKGRHPLLPAAKAVPLDFSIGEKFNTLLITGPNTGGKTVALKTAGLFVLMVQTGMFLPALNVKLPVFKSVFADIGDEQSIEQSLSTFSGHMLNIINILKNVRPCDLVLIDELCAGTDPNEGAALAMSIISYLHELNAYTVITTHYSELKTFAFDREGMENASVEFDQETLMPTYRLLMGIPGSSNAFNISSRLGLSKDIIKHATEFLNTEHAHMENVLQGLEGERRKYEDSNKEMEQLRYESRTLKNELEYQKREFKKQRNEMLRKSKEEANAIYRNSRREAEAVLKELRSLKSNFDTKQLETAAQNARDRLNKQFDVETVLPEGVPLTLDNAQKGSPVYVKTLHKNGVIVDLDAKEVLVSVGILKMKAAYTDCLLIKKGPAHVSEPTKYRKGYAHQMFQAKLEATPTEVDLRGMTTGEAIPIVDKAIDDALLAGMSQVRIIHGKGTGALKAGLTAYLSTHTAVQELGDAPLNEGGAGVTVVKLK